MGQFIISKTVAAHTIAFNVVHRESIIQSLRAEKAQHLGHAFHHAACNLSGFQVLQISL